MMHISREQILEIGNAIEVAGNITLAAAAIFGVLSIFIVLATVDNKKSRQSSNGSTIIFVNNNYPSRHDYYSRSHDDNSNFYFHLLVSSGICSIIGTALAITFQVYWVAITVASLWTAALALSLLGRAMIDYALNLALTPTSDLKIEPSAPSISQMQIHEIPEATILANETQAEPISAEEAKHYPAADARYEQPWLAQCMGY